MQDQAQQQQEQAHLDRTLALVARQLADAMAQGEEDQSALSRARKERRDETEAAFTELYSANNFEALVQLSQFS